MEINFSAQEIIIKIKNKLASYSTKSITERVRSKFPKFCTTNKNSISLENPYTSPVKSEYQKTKATKPVFFGLTTAIVGGHNK